MPNSTRSSDAAPKQPASRSLKALLRGHSSARKRWLDSCRARDAAQERYCLMARDAGLRTQLDDPEIHQEERERVIKTCAQDLDAQLAKLDAEHASLTRLREASGFAAAEITCAQNFGSLSIAVAEHSARMDKFDERLARIERRLEQTALPRHAILPEHGQPN